VLTYFHILVGEMIPKGLALAASEATVRVVYWPMRVLMLIFYPIVIGLNSSGNAVLRLLRIPQRTESHGQVYTPEELQIIVEESADGGALRAESGSLLHELLTFGDVTAGEAMVPRVRVVGIPVGALPDTVKRILRANHHARYPVYEGDLDHIVGMMHVKDLLKRMLADEPVAVADAKPMPMLPTSSTLDVVLETMQKTQAHLAVVIDEHGGTAGVISLEDLFEEVVGEIDEDASAVPPISRAADGTLVVAGTVRLDELGPRFDLDLTHEEVDSVSGLILALLGRPPVVGDSVVYGRVKLDVTSTTGRGVRQAKATLLPEVED
jgi:CBS domain containing-hemolysin-like protein